MPGELRDGGARRSVLALAPAWGSWVVEVKTGSLSAKDLGGIAEFTRRQPSFHPLVLCDDESRTLVERAGLTAMAWRDFLLNGHPDSYSTTRAGLPTTVAPGGTSRVTTAPAPTMAPLPPRLRAVHVVATGPSRVVRWRRE